MIMKMDLTTRILNDSQELNHSTQAIMSSNDLATTISEDGIQSAMEKNDCGLDSE